MPYEGQLIFNWGPYFYVERFIEWSAMHMLKRKVLTCPGHMGGLLWLFAVMLPAGICLLALWLIYTGTFGLITSNGVGVTYNVSKISEKFKLLSVCF